MHSASLLKWQIGDVSVTKVVELTSSSLGAYILPDASSVRLREINWITPFVDDEFRMVMSFHSLVVETPDHLLIVDTCIGNEKARNYPRWHLMTTRFLDDLRDAGFREAQFDTVLCTHMHVDHVGWNTYKHGEQWAPTFPNARYLYARDEWQHWQSESQLEYGPVIEDSVKPIFDLGLADLVEHDHVVCDEVRLVPTPGHTPGHVSVHIESRGEEAIITGDVFHHPCQLANPHWCATADGDQAAALQTRHSFLKNYADRPVLCIGTHFAGVTAGRLVRDGDAYRLDC
ncbi:MAG: MBL fold metallo-hydrolase [Gammaproteobacteria bacterium]|nr:MBL fold metallo-hydrolase [Gammaproteobacteria bacterium]